MKPSRLRKRLGTSGKRTEIRDSKDLRIALVLQGGGALGAYHAGVYQALHERGILPHWIAGTSIGAINGALIAGTRLGSRLEHLQKFWHSVATPDPWDMHRLPKAMLGLNSVWAALQALFLGRPGFFSPRWFIPPVGKAPSEADSVSFYDTTPLRDTLLRLVDFNLINDGPIRLTLDAVRVTTGDLVHFDSSNQQLGPEHVMASSALPPGFPPVRINGDLFWDGGIYSNTPLDTVLDDIPRHNTLCFMVDLWNPAGSEPKNIYQVETRYKDILYASRSREHIEAYRAKHDLRRKLNKLYKLLPKNLKERTEIRNIGEMSCTTTMNIIQLIYPGRDWSLASKDINFSSASMAWRWEQGYRNASRSLDHAAWLNPVPNDVGVVVHRYLHEDK
ncbi:MAG: patatin-like phospholipase family protein [Gammaproteobacteria bacterium]